MAKKELEIVATTSEPILNASLEKLRAVFPQFVKEGQVDFDALKAFFDKEGITAEPEKYGLSWAGKTNAVRALQAPATGTLVPQEKESRDWDKTQNIFIEGDNLEVLKLLQKQYANPGKIKMIYIAPPYNTGKDRVYKDSFTEGVSDYYERTGQSKDGIKLTANLESNGRYHSDWLTMMYPRLFLAKNLLKDDGVIFISIDDNEVANLRLIMDEIFGEENYLNTFCWVNNLKGRQISGTGAAKTYEYILCYARRIEENELFIGIIDNLKRLMPSTYKGFDYETEEDEAGEFVVKNELHNTNSIFNEETRPNLVFNIHYNFETEEVKFTEVNDQTTFEKFAKIGPKKNNDGVHKYHAWRWSRDKIQNELANLKFEKTREGAKVSTKIRDHKTTNLKDLISDITTNSGGAEVKDLFDGHKYFDYPKPIDLIKIFTTQTESDDTILDFFAGSGTTAQAVMAQNAEDGGNRKWICVQLPEATDEDSEAYKAGYKTIAEIARERIRRAGAMIGKGDIGFKALTLEQSNYRRWNVITDADDEKKLLAQEKLFADKPLVDKYDEKAVVYEVLLKEGFSPNASVAQDKKGILKPWVVVDGERKLAVTFADKVTKEQVDALGLSKNDLFVCLDSALDDTTKVNISRNLNVKVI